MTTRQRTRRGSRSRSARARSAARARTPRLSRAERHQRRIKLMIIGVGLLVTIALVTSLLPTLPGSPEPVAPAVPTSTR